MFYIASENAWGPVLPAVQCIRKCQRSMRYWTRRHGRYARLVLALNFTFVCSSSRLHNVYSPTHMRALHIPSCKRHFVVPALREQQTNPSVNALLDVYGHQNDSIYVPFSRVGSVPTMLPGHVCEQAHSRGSAVKQAWLVLIAKAPFGFDAGVGWCCGAITLNKGGVELRRV